MDFRRGPRARPRAGPRGARKIATFSLFSEKSLRRGGFSENFLEIREKSRRTRPPRDFSPAAPRLPGGKVPGVPGCPENSSGIFIFSRIPRTFPPRCPPVPPFSTKSARKNRDFDRIRLLKVPKEKVQRSVSQAAAVLRRSVPAGATVGRRGLMLQRRRGIRREVGFSAGPPGPPPGRAPGGPGNRDFFAFFLEKSLRRGGFSREFLENPREISPDSTPAGLFPRGSATSRGKSPRSSGLPREFLRIS